MSDASTLFVIIIAFFVGYLLVSKLITFLAKGRNSYGQSNGSQKSKSSEESDFSSRSKRTGTDIVDKTALSILTLIGKFEPNPVDENFDKKLLTVQNFLDLNFFDSNISKDQITKAIFYSKNSELTLDKVIFKITSLRPDDFTLYKKIVQLLLDISLVDGILSADEELTILKICIDFNIMNSNPYKSYKDNLESNNINSDNYFNELDKNKYYGKVLGLAGQITKQDIIKKYRELVIKYHPDKVSHLGREFQLLAEIKIKEINSAFDYLKKRYDI